MIKPVNTFEDQQFELVRDRNSAIVFEDMTFNRCHFDNCLLSSAKDPSRRSTVRNVSLVDCTDNGSLVGPAVIEDTLIENFQTPGVFQIFGAVFKHVVLRGQVGDLMISNECLPDLSLNLPYQYENVEAFREANAKYYRNVDWALDISQGEFKELDIRGIPSRLVHRDPETQVVVTRQRLLDADDWRDLDFIVAPCRITFQLLLDLEFDFEDMIIVAPKRHRRFREYMKDLQLLRETGIAEQD